MEKEMKEKMIADGNTDEVNYYDLNDSFINDDEVQSDNEEDKFFKITLSYGNYSEQEVIKNIEKHKKLILKQKTPRTEDSGKKTKKIEQVIVPVVETPNKKADNEIETILSKITKEMIQDSKEKFNLMKKLSSNYRKFTDDNADIFIEKLSLLMEEDPELLKLNFEFDKIKIKRDGYFSTLAKSMARLVVFLTENSIMDINDTSVFYNNEEIKEKLNLIIEKIVSYFKSNESMNVYLNTNENLLKIQTIFNVETIPIQDAKNRILSKFIEKLDSNSVKYNKETFIILLNDFVAKADPIEADLFSFNLSPLKEIEAIIESPEKKKSKSKPKKKAALKEPREEEHTEKSENKEQSNTGEEHILFPPLLPKMSKRFYVKEWQDSDFRDVSKPTHPPQIDERIAAPTAQEKDNIINLLISGETEN